MFTVFSRAWIPLVVVAAVLLGGLGVVQLRGVFGSDPVFSWSGAGSAPIESINTKQVIYQVFGDGGTTGGVSYLAAGALPEHTGFAGLPWAYTVTTTEPAVVASVVAQGDGARLGCRIIVNGAVKDEQISIGRRAQVSCLVKAA